MVPVGKTKKVFDGRYEILAIVGRGARSVVYHARLIANPTVEVALKVLSEREGEPSIREKLKREALAMVSCRHPYVVRLDDFNSLGNLSYFAMEYASQGDLARFVAASGGKIPPEIGNRYLSQCAHALAHIHECGVVHRDIKPDNILVTGHEEIRIADFGIARLPGEDTPIEELESGVGTMDYMSPELLEGKPSDATSDIYSLGLVFYEAISGAHPFRDSPLLQQLDVRREERFPHISDVVPAFPRAIGDMIMRCLRYDPLERFANGRALVNALESAAQVSTRPHITPKEIANDEDMTTKHSPAEQVDLKIPAPQQLPPPKDETRQPRRERFRLKEKPSRVKVREFATKETDESTVQAHSSVEEPKTHDPITGDTIEASPPIQETPSPLLDDPFLTPPAMEEPSTFSPGGTHNDPFARQRTVFIEPETRNDLAPEPPPSARNPRSSLIAAGLVVLTLAFLVLGGNFVGSIIYERSGLRELLRSIFVGKSIDPLVPPVTEDLIAFPLLPSGMYVGTIQGLYPHQEASLTMISFKDRREVTVLIGIEGWTPRTIRVEEPADGASLDDAPHPLRVASNGMVLSLTGREIDGEIVGFFSDNIHGNSGEWRVKPIRAEREEE